MRQFLPTLITLQVGDRVVVPKSNWDMVQHHAIYLGHWNGQYWFIENKENIGVRLISADVFFSGVQRITRVNRFTPRANYSRVHLYEYALSKIGRAYHLINYNCEHLANEIQHRVVKSKQSLVGGGMALAGLALLLWKMFGGKSK